MEYVINVVDYNYETENLELNHSFLEILVSSNIKKLIIIIINGQVGKGKSTFGSVLLNKLLYMKNQSEDDMLDSCVFEASDATKSVTRGINAYYRLIQINSQEDEAILLFDMEGLNGIIDGRSKEEVETKLTKLLTVSLLVSSVFVYLSPIRLEDSDAKALEKLQTRAELLRDQTKIEYPNIYFIISRTSILKLEDGTDKTSGFLANSNSVHKERKEIIIDPEEEKALLDYLSKTTKLNDQIKKNFKANVFPEIDSNEIDLQNPKEVLIKDKLMNEHMYNLICKFETHFKTKPGTSEFMSSRDLADYLIRVINAVNSDKFDNISIERANTLLDYKKKIKESIKKDFSAKFNYDAKLIISPKKLKNLTSELDKDISEYWKNKKGEIKRELSNKIKVAEEVYFTINEFKIFINNLKNESKRRLVNDVNEIQSQQLKIEMKKLKTINREKATLYEKMKIKTESDRETIKNEISKIKTNLDTLKNQIKEKINKISEIDTKIEITQSKIRELKEYEIQDCFNKTELKELMEKLQKLNDKSQKLTQDINKLNYTKNQLEKDIIIQNKIFELKKQENEETMRKNNELEEKEKFLKKENLHASMELTRLQHQINSIMSEIKERKEKIGESEKKIKKNAIEIQQLELEKNDQLAIKSKLENSTELASTPFISTHEIIKKNELVNEKEELREKTIRLEKELEELKKSFTKYKSEYNEEKKILVEDQKQRTENKYNEIIKGEIQKVVLERKSEIYLTEINIDRITNDIADINKEISRKSELIKDKKQECLKEKNDLKLEATKQELLEIQNKNFELKLNKLQSKKAKKEKRHEEARENLYLLETQIETAKKKFEHFQVELKKLEDQKNKEKIDLENELKAITDSVRRSLDSFKEIKSAHGEVSEFVAIIKDFIKTFQALFSKLSTFEETGNYLEDLISQFFEQFSTYKTNKKIYEIIKKIKFRGLDISLEAHNFFNSLLKLENHEFYEKGEVKKFYFNSLTKYNNEMLEYENLFENGD